MSNMSNQKEMGEWLVSHKTILAIVGMAGAGKTEFTAYLEKKGFPFVRFGAITDEEVKRLGLSLTQENERFVREKIRKEEGMGAYAVRAKPEIEERLQSNSVIVIDGLYSWEEYVILKKEFPGLILVHIFAEPNIRYRRLYERPIRPLPREEGYSRDVAELESLNKGGPIAIADYMIENNGDLEHMYRQIDRLFARLHIAL